MGRNARIIATVLLLHVAVLWLLQSGLVRSLTELMVPTQILLEMTAQDAPALVKLVATQNSANPPALHHRPTEPTEPTPLAIQDAIDSSTTAAYTPRPSTEATNSATTNSGHPVSTAQAPPAPAAVVLPSSDADYMHNLKPPYPPMSKRLREQGKVVIRVLIGIDGSAQQVEIKLSSGFDRLDQSALATALRWRYVPGKRFGVAEAMWINLPFTFVLE